MGALKHEVYRKPEGEVRRPSRQDSSGARLALAAERLKRTDTPLANTIKWLLAGGHEFHDGLSAVIGSALKRKSGIMVGVSAAALASGEEFVRQSPAGPVIGEKVQSMMPTESQVQTGLGSAGDVLRDVGDFTQTYGPRALLGLLAAGVAVVGLRMGEKAVVHGFYRGVNRMRDLQLKFRGEKNEANARRKLEYFNRKKIDNPDDLPEILSVFNAAGTQYIVDKIAYNRLRLETAGVLKTLLEAFMTEATRKDLRERKKKIRASKPVRPKAIRSATA